MKGYVGHHRAPWDEQRDEAEPIKIYFVVWRYSNGRAFGWQSYAPEDIIDTDVLGPFAPTVKDDMVDPDTVET